MTLASAGTDRRSRAGPWPAALVRCKVHGDDRRRSAPGAAGRSSATWRPSRLSAAATLLLCLAARTAAAGGGHVVFVNFSNGTEAIQRAPVDDAQRNYSRLCEAASLLPWSSGTDCGTPED